MAHSQLIHSSPPSCFIPTAHAHRIHGSFTPRAGGQQAAFFNQHTARICDDPAPDEALRLTRAALERGLVLVVSLWGRPSPAVPVQADGRGGGDGAESGGAYAADGSIKTMAWLDGGCDVAYPHCGGPSTARAVFSDLVVAERAVNSQPDACALPYGNCWLSRCCVDARLGCFRQLGKRYAQCRPVRQVRCADSDEWLCPGWWERDRV